MGSDSYLASKLDSLKSTFHDALVGKSISQSVSGKRRKRSISTSDPLTCNTLYSFSSASSLSSLTASDLSTLSQSEFTNCMSLYSTYSWSSTQSAALVTLMKANYSGGVSSIPEGDLAYYSTFLIGLTTTELQSLTITSLNTINALGLVNKWSNDQLTSIVAAVKANGNSLTNVLNQMKNLACGISESDWSTISTSTVYSAQTTLITIDNTDCLAISYMYSKLRPSSFDSASLTDLGVISGGFSSSDLTSTAISTELLPFTTLTYVSASTVNSMSNSYLNALTTSQITALINSPNYSSFSDSV